jgi:hypothetical protein
MLPNINELLSMNILENYFPQANVNGSKKSGGGGGGGDGSRQLLLNFPQKKRNFRRLKKSLFGCGVNQAPQQIFCLLCMDCQN